MKVHQATWVLALALAAPAVAQERLQAPASQPQVRRQAPVIRPPLFVPRSQVPPSTPTSNPPLVHFDVICRNVTGLSGSTNVSFDCLRSDGLTETLWIARVVDETGRQIGAGEESQDSMGGMLSWIGASAHQYHYEARRLLSVSQVVQAFMLYKATHPDSPVSMVVRGIETADPDNAGHRVVLVAYFDLN